MYTMDCMFTVDSMYTMDIMYTKDSIYPMDSINEWKVYGHNGHSLQNGQFYAMDSLCTM